MVPWKILYHSRRVYTSGDSWTHVPRKQVTLSLPGRWWELICNRKTHTVSNILVYRVSNVRFFRLRIFAHKSQSKGTHAISEHNIHMQFTRVRRLVQCHSHSSNLEFETQYTIVAIEVLVTIHQWRQLHWRSRKNRVMLYLPGREWELICNRQDPLSYVNKRAGSLLQICPHAWETLR